ncbi:MAG: phosphoribosylformylglycinamidine synthase subunit PurS [Methanosphaera sp.]|nr:phosphoribosylformylglycinamidine synthase subunit PurS [Methanosphaera sp.]
MNYAIEVKISLKKGMLNPEASTIEKSLGLLNYHVTDTQTIDIIKFNLDAESEDEAQREVDEMCQKLLCNPVIHDYEIIISGE